MIEIAFRNLRKTDFCYELRKFLSNCAVFLELHHFLNSNSWFSASSSHKSTVTSVEMVIFWSVTDTPAKWLLKAENSKCPIYAYSTSKMPHFRLTWAVYRSAIRKNGEAPDKVDYNSNKIYAQITQRSYREWKVAYQIWYHLVHYFFLFFNS